MAANSDPRSLASTKRLDNEAAELIADPITCVAFTREPWPGAPSDRVPELWAFHVRNQYTLVFEFPRDYPFSGPYIGIRIIGDHVTPVKRYLQTATSVEMNVLTPKPGYEEAHARVFSDEGMGQLSLRFWSPAVTTRMLVLELVEDPVLQPVLAEAPAFFTLD